MGLLYYFYFIYYFINNSLCFISHNLENVRLGVIDRGQYLQPQTKLNYFKLMLLWQNNFDF